MDLDTRLRFGGAAYMRLADFISRDMEPILAQWEAFAATLMPAAATWNRWHYATTRSTSFSP
jgi:hypothetical protein